MGFVQQRMGMVEQLLRENEGQGDGEQDLRGFEWTYLQSLSQLDLRTLKGHTGRYMP